MLRSIELNLNPRGEGDMSSESLARLDLVLGSFHSALRKKEDQTERYLAALRNPTFTSSAIPAGAFTISASASAPIGHGCLLRLLRSAKRWRSTAILIARI